LGTLGRVRGHAVVGLFLALALPRLKAGMSAAIAAGLLLIWNGAAVWLFAGQGIWLGMVGPTLLLAIGYTALVSMRYRMTEQRNELVESDSIETNKMLGLSFQGQGLLDLAFEKFRKCPIEDDTIKDLLYIWPLILNASGCSTRPLPCTNIS